MSFARSNATPRARLRQACHFQVETLERRVLLSSAIAAFGAQQTFAAGPGPHSLVLADLNRDGKLDAIFADSNDIGVMLGNGDGTFQAPQTFADGGLTPLSIAVADVNGDGKPDIVSANSTNVSVLLGNGDGTFAAPQTFDAGPHAASVAVADVNRDGKPDIIVTNIDSQGTVSVLLGNGDGTFQPRQTFASGLYSLSLAVANVNGDGKSDLIVTHTRSNDLAVLLGNGDGTFQPMQTVATGDEGNAALAVADLNDDGKPDLVLTDYFDDSVGILLGNGDGTFKAESTFAVGAEPQALAIADVNGDGKPDLAIAYAGNGDVGALLGNGDGTFQPASFPIGAPLSTHSLAIADVNGDGRQDLLVTNYNGGTLGVLLGDVPPTVLSIDRTNPPGPYTSDSSVTYTVTFNEPVTGVDPSNFQLALAFLSGVTATTPVIVSGTGASYQVTINGISGTGTLGLNLVDDGSIKDAAGNPLQPGGVASFQSQLYSPSQGGPLMAVADVNGDGKPDEIVFSLKSRSAPPYYPYCEVNVYLGNGDGTFYLKSQQTFGPTTSAPDSVVVADLNEDGKPDLVLGSTLPGQNLKVLLGNGDGSFQAPQTLPLSGRTHALAAADVNGDGRVDIIATSATSNPASPFVDVFLGNGNGTFQAPGTFAGGGFSLSVAVCDVNGDGIPDIVGESATPDSVDVLVGNGNGTFQPERTFSLGFGSISMIAGDVNGDGKEDLVAASDQTNAFSVLLGNGNGTFQAPQTFYSDAGGSLALADVNGDGKLDLIASGASPDRGVAVSLGNGNGTFGRPQTFGEYLGADLAVADLNGDGRPDIVTPGAVLLGADNGDFTGQVYTIVPSSDVITSTPNFDSLSLARDSDGQHIDWTVAYGGPQIVGQLFVNDPNGLTILGNGYATPQQIRLDYTNGDPLPTTLHLSGLFDISGIQGTNPLANTTLEIGKGTVYISYPDPASDPLSAIQGYLQAGFNGGAWNGTPTAATGVITSAAAAANPNHNTAIGYADVEDPINYRVNAIELKYTLYGDANLDAQVNSADLQILLANLNHPGAWDQGDFNYDGQVNSADLQALLFTLNTSLGSQATPMAIAATDAVTTPANADSSGSSGPSRHLVPAFHATGTTGSAVPHPHPAKVSARKRR